MGIRYLDENNETGTTAKGTKVRYLDDETTLGDFASGVGDVAMGALETVAIPFQAAGEAVRGAGESEPLQFATAEDPRGFRVPSAIQRIAPSLRTEIPPADVFTKAYQGLEGIANLPFGIDTASEAVTREPGLIEQIGGMGLGLGVGSLAGAARKLPKAAKTVSKTLPKVPPAGMADDILKTATEVPPAGTAGRVENIFKTAPEVPPAGAAGMADDVLKSAEPPPPPGAGKVPPGTPPAGSDPLAEVDQWVIDKFGRAQKSPNLWRNMGKAIEQKGQGMRLKEIGGPPGMIRKLRERFGEDMVENLANLAEDKGISKGFFNFQTGNAIKKLAKTAGQKIEAIRDIATKRGAIHDKGTLINQIRAELDPQFMRGIGSTQKNAYLKALQDISDSGTDAASLAKTLTKKNAFLAGEGKVTLPLGAARKVYQTATRLNNKLINSVLSPEEIALHETVLKDVSAAKVFDKMYGFTFGRDWAGRTGPSGPWNMAKDIGVRKVMEKAYTTVGRGMQKSPSGPASLKALGSDILDAFDEAINEIIDQAAGGTPPGMAFGGIVGEMDSYLTPRYGGQQ